MKKKYFCAILLIISIHFKVSLLWAGTTGKISGVITDSETGIALPGVNVVVIGTNLGAATDRNGYFAILNVYPGTYDIRISMMGYKPVKIEGVNVSVDLTTNVNYQMESTVLDLGETVTVMAQNKLVRKDRTSTAAAIGSDEISNMPVEEFKQILELQAGIVTGSGGDTHMRGGRASEVSYLINGISVTDPFSGDIAVEVENTGIQEVQVISGTFNAEYGQAMSGIVEIVTKEGGENLSGQFSCYTGDYLSNHSETFLNINDFEPFSIYNVQASLSGPIPFLGEKFSFFSTGRIYNTNGWLFGRRIFNPSDSSNFNSPDPEEWYIEKTGDNKIVPMNPYNKKTGQVKLTYRPSSKIKFNYEFIINKIYYREYDHSFKYNPDGNYHNYKNGYTHLLTWNHTISSRTFYKVKFSNFFFDYKRYVHEDPYDIRYVNPQLLKGNFVTGGTQMGHFYRNTKTIVGKFDLTSQINMVHQVKTGIEARKHKLWLHEYEIKLDRSTNWKPEIPPDTIGVVKNNKYTHCPLELSFYLQDKMEFDDMIVNAGIRYDYFKPDGSIPIKEYYYTTSEGDKILREGERDPLIAPKEIVKGKHQISPRIGIAYPITDRGIIHFSYGHFFQMPTFEHLYHNSEFEVEFGGLKTLMGNADLKPQQTVIYEIGLQQQISDDIGVDITGFYKDIRNLLGTKIVQHYTATMFYAKYVNRDYGNVRGVTFALEKRRTKYFSARIDYTYQIAEGNASDPNSAFLDNQTSPPRETEIRVLPLDWDQTHTLNFSLIISQPGWGLSILSKLGSGLPYTPAYQGIRTGYENSERKPPMLTVDLNAHKEFSLMECEYSVFLKIYNLFDRKNEVRVYEDTGRAGYTLRSFYAGEWRNFSTLKDYLNRPDYYSEPRRVIFGISITL